MKIILYLIYIFMGLTGVLLLLQIPAISQYIGCYFNWLGNTTNLVNYISTIILILTLLLIYFTFSQTKKQTFDTSFFNFIDSHNKIIDRLQKSSFEILKRHYENLKNSILDNNYYQDIIYDNSEIFITKLNNVRADIKDNTIVGKDFFDVLYYILDVKYKIKCIEWGKGKDISDKTKEDIYKDLSVKERIDEFFKGYSYLIDRYCKNFIAIIKFIDERSEKGLKNSYYDILKNTTTLDELRLIFFAIIWRADDEAKEWKKLLTTKGFIQKGDKDFNLSIDDWEAFENV